MLIRRVNPVHHYALLADQCFDRLGELRISSCHCQPACLLLKLGWACSLHECLQGWWSPQHCRVTSHVTCSLLNELLNLHLRSALLFAHRWLVLKTWQCSLCRQSFNGLNWILGINLLSRSGLAARLGLGMHRFRRGGIQYWIDIVFVRNQWFWLS